MFKNTKYSWLLLLLLVIVIGAGLIGRTEVLSGYIFKRPPAFDEDRCHDSDNGKDIETQGTIYGSLNGRPASEQDYCNAAGKLVEHYCARNAEIKNTEYICDKKCVDGKCLTDNNTNFTTCGDGEKQKWEDCDGESFCNENCEIKQKYTLQNWIAEEWSSDYVLTIGDKLQIEQGLNIRIENIKPVQNDMSMVNFSIWGRALDGECRFISNTGYLYYPPASDEGFDSFREFTDAFIELMDVNDNEITIRKYIGTSAYNRCMEIGGWKKDIACSFYPDDDENFYIENAWFRVFLRQLNNQHVERAELIADTLVHYPLSLIMWYSRSTFNPSYYENPCCFASP